MQNKMKYKLIIAIALLSASCTNNQNTLEPEQVQVPPELMPSIKEEPKPVTVVNENYSPGNSDWQIPTKEEQNEWDHDVYITVLRKWAKPQLDNWMCQACKNKLSKDFKFKSRIDNDIKFECKCECDHIHTVTLKDRND